MVSRQTERAQSDGKPPNWQRWLKITKPGKWEVYAIYDGVASNSLGFTFIP